MNRAVVPEKALVPFRRYLSERAAEAYGQGRYRWPRKQAIGAGSVGRYGLPPHGDIWPPHEDPEKIARRPAFRKLFACFQNTYAPGVDGRGPPISKFAAWLGSERKRLRNKIANDKVLDELRAGDLKFVIIDEHGEQYSDPAFWWREDVSKFIDVNMNAGLQIFIIRNDQAAQSVGILGASPAKLQAFEIPKKKPGKKTDPKWLAFEDDLFLEMVDGRFHDDAESPFTWCIDWWLKHVGGDEPPAKSTAEDHIRKVRNRWRSWTDRHTS
jgi:hypothetical protein